VAERGAPASRQVNLEPVSRSDLTEMAAPESSTRAWPSTIATTSMVWRWLAIELDDAIHATAPLALTTIELTD
jgi:hypothetical protein